MRYEKPVFEPGRHRPISPVSEPQRSHACKASRAGCNGYIGPLDTYTCLCVCHYPQEAA